MLAWLTVSPRARTRHAVRRGDRRHAAACGTFPTRPPLVRLRESGTGEWHARPGVELPHCKRCTQIIHRETEKQHEHEH